MLALSKSWGHNINMLSKGISAGGNGTICLSLKQKWALAFPDRSILEFASKSMGEEMT